MHNHAELLHACGEFAVGCLLFAFNGAWWAGLLRDVSVALSFVSMVCAAIIGVHGVYRIWKGRR
jgi:hypothetical protein